MNKIRIACIGDSITYGSSIKFRKWNNYPYILGKQIKSNVIVKNFGVSGACALRNSDQPFLKERKFTKSLIFRPDIVLIMLGTNDSKTHNWNLDKFKSDYMNLLDKYISCDSKPKVYLLTTIPGFENIWDMQCDVIENQILPTIHEIAEEMKIHLIDTFTPFINKSYLTTDNIHPNKFGAKLLAAIVRDKLKLESDIYE